MPTEYRIIVTDTAFSDIQSALSFLSRVSMDAAKSLNEQIKKMIMSLNQFPFRFETIDMPKKLGLEFRKAVIDKRYLLVYAIKDQTVIIERLLDARQGYSSLL